MKHQVLYIPGLGDHYDSARSLALKLWYIYGFKLKLLPVKWYGASTYQEKLALVADEIKKARAQGYEVTLVGESAGASLALNIAARTPGLHKVILIAGVNSPKLSISPHIQKRSPAFVQSSSALTGSLQKVNTSKIHTIRGIVDATVSPRFNDILGARSHVVFGFGHIPIIMLCLTIFSPLIAKIIRSK